MGTRVYLGISIIGVLILGVLILGASIARFKRERVGDEVGR